MKRNYKLKYHLRNYIKQELYDYNRNKQILEDLQKNILNTKECKKDNEENCRKEKLGCEGCYYYK